VYVHLRPAPLLPGVQGHLRDKGPGPIGLFIRESTSEARAWCCAAAGAGVLWSHARSPVP